jgi:hypothetical protein
LIQQGRKIPSISILHSDVRIYLEYFEILTALKEFRKSELTSASVQTLNWFKDFNGSIKRMVLDRAKKYSSQTDSSFEEVDIATDFLCPSIHLEIRCIVMVRK